MPPKGATKPKKEVAKVKKEATAPEPAPKKPAAPRRVKEPAVFNSLDRDRSAVIPVDVTYEGSTEQAKLRKTGEFEHHIKLNAPNAFSLVKTVNLTEGEYAGYQAILLQPAKAFDFLGLPKEARVRIYRYYLAPSGVVGNEISIDGKRSENKNTYAKTYAHGQKNRVALLAVNQELNAEATPVLYAQTIKFESTTTLMDFLGVATKSMLPLLTHISIKQYVKTTARFAMHFLAEAPNVRHLYIESGVYSDGNPEKAAKDIYGDMHNFLEAIGARAGDKTAGVDVIRFGMNALQFKDGNKKLQPWGYAQIEDFKDLMKQKLQ